MATLWLLQNIPFNDKLENVVDFNNKEQQRSFFVDNASRTLDARPIKIDSGMITLQITYNDMLDFNYMMFEEIDINGINKVRYYFINNVSYVSQDSCAVQYTLDTYQTYMFDFKINDAFIKREHQHRFTKEGLPIYNLEKEDIELGNKYEVIDKDKLIEADEINGKKIIYYVILSTEKLTKHIGEKITNITGINIGLYASFVPYIVDIEDWHEVNLYNNSKRLLYKRNPNLTEDKVFFEKYLKLQGVVAIYPTLTLPVDVEYRWTHTMGGPNNLTNIYTLTADKLVGPVSDDDPRPILINNLKLKKEIEVRINKPKVNTNSNKNINSEPKLFTKPFTVYSLTDKNIDPHDVGIDELGDKVVYVESMGNLYKSRVSTNGYNDGQFFNTTINTKNNELPLLNDRYQNYIANNKASATTGVALSSITGALGIGGGALGIASGGMGAMLGFMALNQGLSSSKKVINEMLTKSDLSQAPLSLKNVGNDLPFHMTYGADEMGLTLYTRRPLKQFTERAFEYMFRYGYSVNNFGVPNLKSRKRFNYIQCVNIEITGNIPQKHIDELRNIFTSGVTIWHYYKGFKMYDYNLENEEVYNE